MIEGFPLFLAIPDFPTQGQPSASCATKSKTRQAVGICGKQKQGESLVALKRLLEDTSYSYDVRVLARRYDTLSTSGK